MYAACSAVATSPPNLSLSLAILVRTTARPVAVVRASDMLGAATAVRIIAAHLQRASDDVSTEVDLVKSNVAAHYAEA